MADINYDNLLKIGFNDPVGNLNMYRISLNSVIELCFYPNERELEERFYIKNIGCGYGTIIKKINTIEDLKNFLSYF